MWKNFSQVFVLVHLSSYINASLVQKQNINVMQVYPVPPTVIPEGLLNFKKPPDSASPLHWTWCVEGSQLSNRSAHYVFWLLIN